MPSRRAVLGALPTTLVAGCVAGTGDEPNEAGEPSETSEPSKPSQSRTATGTPSGTGTPYYDGECDAGEHEWVDPERDSIEPKALPDDPPAFDEVAVESFVASYEEAYLHNSLLQENTEGVGVVVGPVTTEQVPGGFVVSLQSYYYYNEQAVTTGNETATVVHADGPKTMKAYLVTHQRLVRAEGEYNVTPDPRNQGETVECWSAE